MYYAPDLTNFLLAGGATAGNSLPAFADVPIRHSSGVRPLLSKTSPRPFPASTLVDGGDLIASVHSIVPPPSVIRRPIVSVVSSRARRLAPTIKSFSSSPPIFPLFHILRAREDENRRAQGGNAGRDGRKKRRTILHSDQSTINVTTMLRPRDLNNIARRRSIMYTGDDVVAESPPPTAGFSFSGVLQVSKEEYETCRITNSNPRVIAVCDKPRKTMYFTITFRPFTPQPGGLEFLPGHDYYFISTSSKDDLHRRIGGRCTSHNMKVVFKVCCGADAQTSSSSATSRNNCK